MPGRTDFSHVYRHRYLRPSKWERHLFLLSFKVFLSSYDTFIIKNYFHFICRPLLVHRMTLVSFRLFRKNLGNLKEFFGQIVHRPRRPPLAKNAGTPVVQRITRHLSLRVLSDSYISSPFNSWLKKLLMLEKFIISNVAVTFFTLLAQK